MIIPVILSGGSGSRLWPLSRAMRPKQLLPLVSELTMIQETIIRLEGITDITDPIIICNEEHRFLIAEQIRALSKQPLSIILEPAGRNTAPAVTASALNSLDVNQDAVLLVLPADHIIQDTQAFQKIVATGYQAALEDKLVTFGIVPQSPETGYGYIKQGAQTDIADIFQIEQFIEKPDNDTASHYLQAGGYLWNSGMFMFKSSCYLEEIKKHNASIYAACLDAYDTAQRDLDFIRLDKTAFENCPSDSIDYAVMEKTHNAVVIPADVGWDDIGSWTALQNQFTPDQNGNVIVGDVIAKNTSNTYIRSDNRLVSTIGVSDLVIVDTADAILISHKDSVQQVKDIVEQLKRDNRDEAIIHKKAFRPWGSYECIDTEERFKVKRISVNPGASLSLQLHHHRAEHWVVVKGTARVTCDEKTFILSENESTYIPLGKKHRLENTGKIPLEIIEVQTGSYLGEDDIERFDDIYGREKN